MRDEPIKSDTIIDEDEIFRSLNHQIRRNIIKILGENPLSFTGIKKKLEPIDNPTLSYHLKSLESLLIQKVFLISIIFGISAVGLGIIIASISKNVQVANAFSLTIYMALIFLSGSIAPFESPIVYFTPPYWAKQIYLQITVLGHGLNDKLYSSSLIGDSAQEILIPIWGGVLIVIAIAIAFISLGIFIFQKKTKF